MKNFSELLATNTSSLLKVSVTLIEHGNVRYSATINNVAINSGLTNVTLDLFSPVNLCIDLLEFTEGSSGVEVSLFTVNGLEVLPLYQQLASSANNYVDQLGRWEFCIPSPFYNWYHGTSGQGWLLTPR